MFESLDERIKHDDQLESSKKERVLRYIAIAIVSVLLFAGLFLAVRYLS